MRNKNLLFLFLLAISCQLFFACNSAKQYQFSNSSQSYHGDKVLAKTDPVDMKEPVVISKAPVVELVAVPENLTADAGESAPMPVKPEVNLREPEVKETAKTVVNTNTKQLVNTREQKKQFKTALKQLKTQAAQGTLETSQPTVSAVELIFAILIPPVGVLLHEDGINGRFWLSLLLTLLFYFPGMIYAVLVVTDVI